VIIAKGNNVDITIVEQMIIPFVVYHFLLKSEYSPLNAISVNSKLAVVNMIKAHLLKIDTLAIIYLIIVVSLVNESNPIF